MYVYFANNYTLAWCAYSVNSIWMKEVWRPLVNRGNHAWSHAKTRQTRIDNHFETKTCTHLTSKINFPMQMPRTYSWAESPDQCIACDWWVAYKPDRISGGSGQTLFQGASQHSWLQSLIGIVSDCVGMHLARHLTTRFDPIISVHRSRWAMPISNIGEVGSSSKWRKEVPWGHHIVIA